MPSVENPMPEAFEAERYRHLLLVVLYYECTRRCRRQSTKETPIEATRNLASTKAKEPYTRPSNQVLTFMLD